MNEKYKKYQRMKDKTREQLNENLLIVENKILSTEKILSEALREIQHVRKRLIICVNPEKRELFIKKGSGQKL